VGATAPTELAHIRRIAPGLAFLVPGVGAQGGEIDPVLEYGPANSAPAGIRPGGGLLVNVSRGIASAATAASTPDEPADPGERLDRATRRWAALMPVLP
jgi:orotidine-5'-phosphate decarboxylase